MGSGASKLPSVSFPRTLSATKVARYEVTLYEEVLLPLQHLKQSRGKFAAQREMTACKATCPLCLHQPPH